MSEWRPSDAPSGQPRWGEPAQSEPYDPNAGYPTAYPQAPGYGYPPPPGYPAYQGAAYPVGVVGEQRPGTIIAGAVLGYIAGGLLIFAGVLLFRGASALNDLDDTYGISDSYGAELAIMGFLNLVTAGLLIGGSVAMTNRSRVGRNLYAIGAAMVLVLTVYWLARWASKSSLSDIIVWALLFAALVIVGTSLACTGAAARWISRRGH